MHKININNQPYIMRIIIDENRTVNHKAQLEVYTEWKDTAKETTKPKLFLIKNKRFTKSWNA